MKKKNITKTTMSLAAAMGCLAMSANAASVTINNHDFSTGNSHPVVQGWDSDNNSGINNAQPFGAALWINFAGIVSQTTSEAIVAGTTYTLTVDIGQQTNWTADGGIIRLYGSDSGPGVALAEFDSGNLPARGDSLLDQTTSFVATAGQATGQFVGVALIGGVSGAGPGIQVRFDNVRLDATAVPEPTAAALLGLGGLALLRRRRK